MMNETIILAIITLCGSLAGSAFGLNLVNHRLDTLEKKLSKMEDIAQKIIEHEVRICNLEQCKNEKK